MSIRTRIKLTPTDLRNLADKIENRAEYGNMHSYVVIRLEEKPTGKQYVDFAQPCKYADCNAEHYVIEE